MVSRWKRVVATVLVPLALAFSGLMPQTALASKAANPCKANPKSSACKATKTKSATKKNTAKTSSAKATTKKNVSKTAAKSSSKKAVTRKTPSKKAVATKNTTKKSVAKAKATRQSAAAKRKAAQAAKVARQRAAAAAIIAPPAAASVRDDIEALRSTTAYVQDLETSTVLFAKNDNVVRPIASISKLMTALVVVDSNQPMDEMLEITEADIDTLKRTTSRLVMGTRLSRGDMLHLALMSSENRAANALGRHYPGGLPAFVAAMNDKARALGMSSTHFTEPTGLSSQNVSSPRDLARLLRAASQRPLIHRYSTDDQYEVDVANRTQIFRNTNLLVRKPDWDIKVSKTGYINEAGECLVMLARINGRDVAMVLLDSQGKLSRIGDAVRLRRILQSDVAML